MSKIAVIYWSGTGNTQAMASAVAEGAKEAGAEADLLACGDVSGVSAYDAVALGCPAMGAEELESSEFVPMLESIEPELAGKKVALFGSYGWGDGEWMRSWEARCAEKGIALVLILCLLMMTAAFGVAETADDAAEALELLENIKGTYEPLFPVITAPEYDQIWMDPCAAALGEENAPEMVEMLKSACSGTIYGQEAIDAFGDGSEGAQFDCLFIGGVAQITFDGTVISGVDENGNAVFSHEYAYAGPLSLAGMMDGYLFETADADAGEFRYFFMMPDTPATTYHLEFRYGSDKDNLAAYNAGPYAYWLAAGFPVDADEEMIKNVITLFCEENLGEEEAEDAA